jgi:hypothetical protein
MHIDPGSQLVSYPKLQLVCFPQLLVYQYLHDSSLHISPCLQPNEAGLRFPSSRGLFFNAFNSTAFLELQHIV